jgi:hypothetical protein
MKKLLFTFVIVAFLFALAGWLEHKWDMSEKIS